MTVDIMWLNKFIVEMFKPQRREQSMKSKNHYSSSKNRSLIIITVVLKVVNSRI